MNFLMSGLLFLTTCIYAGYGINYVSTILKAKKSRFILYFVSPGALVSLFLVQMYLEVPFALIYIILIVGFYFYLQVCFEGKATHKFWCAVNFTFHIIVVDGLVISTTSLILGINMFMIIQNEQLWMLVSLIAAVALIVLLYAFGKTVDTKKVLIFLDNSGQFNFVVVVQTIMLSFLILSSYAYYYNLDLIWFTMYHFLISSYLLISFYWIFIMAVKTSIWMKEEINGDKLLVDVNRQVKKYTSEKNLLDTLKKNNHDQKHLLHNLRILLENDDVENATKLLSSMEDELVKISKINDKEYSNKLIVCSILNDIESQAEEKLTKFSAECFIPEELKITDIEWCKVLSNLCSNALEATEKIPNIEDRWFEIKSAVRDKGFILIFKNTFHNPIKITDNELLTTKENREYHGIGISVVKEIIKNSEGVCSIEVDKVNRIFSFTIYVGLD